MRTSESQKEFSKAMLLVQSKLPAAKKDSKNPFFKSTYSDYPTVVETSQPLLTEHGFEFSHAGEMVEGVYGFTTRLTHSPSGEWRESFIPRDSKPQEIGSAFTYAKRYSHQGILGMMSDDDDGEAAMSRPVKEAKKVFEGSQVVTPEPSLLMDVFARARKVGFTKEDWLIIANKVWGFDSASQMQDLTDDRLKMFIPSLEKIEKKKLSYEEYMKELKG